jgi:hypothetical protein
VGDPDLNRGRSLGWVERLVLAGLVVGAPAARAATLPFTGSLSILLGSFGVGIPNGGIATVNGSGGFGQLDSIEIPAGAFDAQRLVVSITTPAALPLRGIQRTAANADGSFTKPGSGSIGILGAAKVCLFGPCSGAVANLVVPLDVVGVGGTTYVTAPVNVTVVGAPVDQRHGRDRSFDRARHLSRVRVTDLEHRARIGFAAARDAHLHPDEPG